MSDPAYILFWDTSHVGDEEVTAALVDFEGSINVAAWMMTRPVTVPERIYFEARFDTLRRLDYVDNDKGWPLMSERMRAILLPRAPQHRVIPVVMLDDEVSPAKRFKGATPRPGVAVEGFAAVQLLERTDAMDMERSSFSPDERFPGRARTVEKLILNEVALPPLFRLTAYPAPLFISAAARDELERAQIKGAKYWPLARISST
jgi:hypothetical protein